MYWDMTSMAVCAGESRRCGECTRRNWGGSNKCGKSCTRRGGGWTSNVGEHCWGRSTSVSQYLHGAVGTMISYGPLCAHISLFYKPSLVIILAAAWEARLGGYRVMTVSCVPHCVFTVLMGISRWMTRPKLYSSTQEK